MSNAQTVSTDYANTVNSIFAGVDLNRVPHHLLTDYAMEFVDVAAYPASDERGTSERNA